MTYHWTIDGIPACDSPLTLDSRLKATCAHATREEAQENIDQTRALYAGYDFDYQIVEGSCAQPNDLYSYSENVGYDAGIAAALEVAPDSDELQRRLIAAGKMDDPEARHAKEQALRDAHERQQAAREAVREKPDG